MNNDFDLVEVKVLLPQIVWDRFKDPHTFLGDSAKPGVAYSASKRMSKFLLNYHKLLTRKEVRDLTDLLNDKKVTKAMRAYDDGAINADEANEMAGCVCTCDCRCVIGDKIEQQYGEEDSTSV